MTAIALVTTTLTMMFNDKKKNDDDDKDKNTTTTKRTGTRTRTAGREERIRRTTMVQSNDVIMIKDPSVKPVGPDQASYL